MLIEAAGRDYPGPYWLVGDLAELDLPARDITEPFDVIAGREYEFGQFLDDLGEAGFTSDLLLSTWDLRPFRASSDFLVTLLRRA